MKVLVACESSGTVREAFRKLGHNAWSCDLLPADDGSPFHFQQDCLQVINGGFIVADDSVDPLWPAFMSGAIGHDNGDLMDAKDPRTGEWGPYPAESVGAAMQWDIVIAHPPCTYLSSSGLHWNKRRPGRAEQTNHAAEFFMGVVNACSTHAKAWAIENPIGCMSRLWLKPDQIIHPHQFGHNASKSTCLWLHNLPKLTPTKHIEPRIVSGLKRWGNQTDSGQNRLSPSADRWKIRSKTFQGIADAMAQQWGCIPPNPQAQRPEGSA